MQSTHVDTRSSRTHLINRGRVRCQRFGAAARREEGEYPSWIFDRRATQPQRQRSATLRAKLWQAAGGVAPQSQNASAMLLRRALPATRQGLAHSFPIYEMGSKRLGFIEERQEGSHIRLMRGSLRVTVPAHRALAPKTLQSCRTRRLSINRRRPWDSLAAVR
jgi:hypothetical protein